MDINKNPTHANESLALKVSIAGAFLMAFLGFGFSILTESEAIFLDGVFSLINMSMGIISLKVSKLVISRSTRQFHYGKAQLEPLLNSVKSLIFIVVISIAGYSAFHSLLAGGSAMVFGWAILYSFVAAIGCFSIGYYIESKHKISPTPLLDVEAKAWMIDGMLSAVVLAAFIAGFFISKTSYHEYTAYIDPALLIIMSLLILPVPFKILKSNLMELLLVAPDEALQKKLHHIINDILKLEPVEAFELRLVKTGRFILCDVMILISNKDDYLLTDFDPVRRAMINKITTLHPEVDMVIELTADNNIYQDNTLK